MAWTWWIHTAEDLIAILVRNNPVNKCWNVRFERSSSDAADDDDDDDTATV